MNVALQKACKMLYGPKMSEAVMIRLLARDMELPEQTVNRWWHDKYTFIEQERLNHFYQLVKNCQMGKLLSK
ncbi:MAG: hypothetical protein HQL54_03020 [Magnetococcales bacterium]|nr:hypothetical protein [Magnetococcales bacterium]